MRKALLTLLCLSFFMAMNACDNNRAKVEGQSLTVAFNPGALSYQRFSNLQAGYEFEILQKFSIDVGLNLKVRIVRGQENLKKLVDSGQVDMAAGRITDTVSSAATPRYDSDKLQLICHRSVKLNREIPQVPSLSARYSLRRIHEGKMECAWVDAIEGTSYRRIFPNLRLVQESAKPKVYHFLISQNRPDLQMLFNSWSKNSRNVVSSLKAEYQSRASELHFLDVRKFLRLKDSTLPTYVHLLRKYARDFSIPWQLVAAVSYQESKWNPEAVSFTGVRGFMQLTKQTAAHLGVDDRTDSKQSIYGGAKYLRMLLDRQPKYLNFQERLALALATYNVGPAHMLDAQNLALRLGKDPYSWKDLKTVLPLLANPIYFPELKYGPARGNEPVIYVTRVFAFLDLITSAI
jgi:membrane-bound lytic murein transglycosylase F